MMEDRYRFRAKRTKDGKWIEGSYQELCDYDESSNVIARHAYIVCEPEDTQGRARSTGYPVDAKTVGQCTGLKDRKDKLIFAGDWVLDIPKGLPMLVIWDGCGWCLKAKSCNISAFPICRDTIEITGTIHDKEGD